MKYIDKVDIKEKTILLRADFNVPIKNNKIEDDYRIVKSLNTINYLINNNCKIIILSHLGKVKSIEDKNKKSLKIVFKKLKKLINTKIYFSESIVGKEVENKVNNLKKGEILLLENTRFLDLDNNIESNCDENLSKFWASLGDIFVMDAFGTAHRKHASTYGISKFIPTCYGFLVKNEIKILKEALNNKDKILILGGAKIEDKLNLIKNLLPNSSKLLIGGKMCATFLKGIGKKVDESQVNESMLNEITALYKDNVNKLFLPLDIIDNNGKLIKVNDLNFNNISDIGIESVKFFKNIINNNSLVIWNGPLGNTDDKRFRKSTKRLLKHLANNNIKTIIAGGDTASIAHLYNLDFYHISTGGGATLKYLEGENLIALGGNYETDNI